MFVNLTCSQKKTLEPKRKRPIKQIQEFISHTPETTGLTTGPWILPSPYSGKTGFDPGPPWPPLYTNTRLSPVAGPRSQGVLASETRQSLLPKGEAVGMGRGG